MGAYSFDTSAILDAWVRYYPIDTFVSLWENFANSVRQGNSFAIEQVQKELDKKDDGCLDWFKAQELVDIFFVDLDTSIQTEVSQLLLQPIAQKLVSHASSIAADPFVIALARTRRLTVVTGEKATHNSNKPKMPDVCDHFQVDCIDILEFFRRENWRF